MSDVFQEVDEELRRQHLDKVFKTYGPLILSGLIVILVGYAGFMFWQGYQERRASAAADQLMHGIESLVGGDEEGALATFGALGDSGPDGYAMLAAFQEAGAMRQMGNLTNAIATYDSIAANNGYDAEFRDLAQFYAGLTAISSPDATYEDITNRLEPVATGNSPWRYHAQEALGYAALREGQNDVAETYYESLTADALVPAGIAARANEMLNVALAAVEAEGGADAPATPEAESAPAEDAPTE